MFDINLQINISLKLLFSTFSQCYKCFEKQDYNVFGKDVFENNQGFENMQVLKA